MNTEYLNIVLKDIKFSYNELKSNPYLSYLKHNQYRSFYESYIRLLDTFGNYLGGEDTQKNLIKRYS